MGAMSIGHWLIVLVVMTLVFGPKRLGNVGKGLGEGLKGLRDGLAGRGEDEVVPTHTRASTDGQGTSLDSGRTVEGSPPRA